jgi:hypothetical protein
VTAWNYVECLYSHSMKFQLVMQVRDLVLCTWKIYLKKRWSSVFKVHTSINLEGLRQTTKNRQHILSIGIRTGQNSDGRELLPHERSSSDTFKAGSCLNRYNPYRKPRVLFEVHGEESIAVLTKLYASRLRKDLNPPPHRRMGLS